MKTEVFVVLASIFPFLPALFGEFVFDDWESVVNNPIVNGKHPLTEILSRDFWGRPLSSPHSHKSFRPLTTLILRIQWLTFKGTASGFHAVNLCLHAVVTLLLLKVFRKLEERWNVKKSVAGIATTAFAVHPVHTEAVANVTGGAELFSAFFIALGLLYFLKYSGDLSLTETMVLLTIAFAAVFSKEQGIVFLPICGLISLLERRKSAFLSLSLLTVAVIWIRWRMGGTEVPIFSPADNPAAFTKDPVLRWLSFSWQWLLHIHLLVLPFDLCFDYSMGCVPPFATLYDPRLLLLISSIPLGITAPFMLYGSISTDHQRLLIFGCLFGLLSFFPASNIPVTVGFSVAERVLYLPSIGYCILLAIVINKFQKVWKLAESSTFVLFLLAVSIAYQRSHEWRTEFSLYSSGLRVCPKNAKIHYNIAKISADNGNLVEAEMRYREAVRLNPEYGQALNNLGNLLEKEGRWSEAEGVLRAAVAVQPQYATAWMNLGIATMHSGKYNVSLFAFEESLKRRPHSADCHFNMGNLHQRMKQLQKAITSWKDAIKIDPLHSAAWTNTLVALDETGGCEEVVRLAPLALLHVPSNAAVRSQLGVCFGQLGRFAEAEGHLLEAVRLSPKNDIYRANCDALRHFKENGNRAKNRTSFG